MEQTIFKFITRYSMRQQVMLLILIGFSFPFLYMSLDLPKTIINEAIGGNEFPRDFFGHELSQVPYLMVLCGIFLMLVLINGAFKYTVNVFKGRMGEQMLRRLRYILYRRTMRFPLPQFRRTSQGEVISMVTAEVEPLGGFFGDAIALPAFQGGILITLITFMFVQDPILGTAAIALYPVQMYLIPKLQKQVNQLGKRRIKEVRKLSERIGETISGMPEVHANDTSAFELSRMSRQLGKIYDIRYEIYKRKFFIKFLNNFIAQVTPFLFYAIGGYLVIAGDLTFGALVAVLAAYKDLSAPWKELLRYYQTKEDSRIKYEQLIEQFQPAGMMTEELQEAEADPGKKLEGQLVASNLTLEEDGGIIVLDGASFLFDLNQNTAILGRNNSGTALLLARLLQPTSGSIRIGDENLAQIPESVTGRRMAYVDQSAYVFNGTIKDNLLYGLKHRPDDGVEMEDVAYESFVSDAEAAGNSTNNPEADWIDYEALGTGDSDGIFQSLMDAMETVELQADVYALGLGRTLDPETHPERAERIMQARGLLFERLQDNAYKNIIEPFDAEAYNLNMSVAENILYGIPKSEELDINRLAENPYVMDVLARVELTATFLDVGAKLAAIMVELFQDLPPDHEYFERFSFISGDDLPVFQAIVTRVDKLGLDQLSEEDQKLLMSLPFKLTVARHRLGLINEQIQQKILEARKAFVESLPEDMQDQVAFFRRDEYNPAASLQDNILFGRLVYGRQQSQEKARKLIETVVDEMGLRRNILEYGLESETGVGGGRLSVAQRQKIAMARAILKKPDILIVNDALAPLDPASAASILFNVANSCQQGGLVWVSSQLDIASHFDKVIILDSGKVLDQGSFAELSQPGRHLAKIMME